MDSKGGATIPLTLKGKVAIASYGDSYVLDQEHYKTPLELAVDASRQAMEKVGLHIGDIDGLLTARAPMGDTRFQWNNILAQELRMAPRYSCEVTIHGGGPVSFVRHAAMALMSGLVKRVLCVATDSFSVPARNVRAHNIFWEANHWFDYPYGAYVPALYGLVAQRYIHEYNVKREQAAKLAVEERKWALRHPMAAMKNKGNITIDDVLNSPLIASPFHLLDCAYFGKPVGASGAFIVTLTEEARKLTENPVYVLGTGELSTHDNITQRLHPSTSPPTDLWNTITTSGGREASREAFRMARLRPRDIDIAEISDQFTYIGMLNLEDSGLCEKGKAGKFLEEGRGDFNGGQVAINTHGGFLSFGQPGISCDMNPLLIEAIRQLKGEALGRQVKDARFALIQGHGGVMACHSIAILGNQRSN
ncbi:MAG TPA: thiolase family protein [Nitrososphaerales archaeon]|nr:thiolase family protein [Nitrososphaerales archaeon]